MAFASAGLKSSEQCPNGSEELKATVFIKNAKLRDNFWSDLLEEKCPEGQWPVPQLTITASTSSAIFNSRFF